MEAMRPLQWSKNLVVFAGLIFAGRFHEGGLVLTTLGAFAAFCLLSSSVYIVNDLADAARDRLHPLKRKRPVASGRLGKTAALTLSLSLAVVSLAWSFYLQPLFGVLAAGYWGLMVVYSFVLKHEVILDVFVIASGFVIRAIGGAVVISVYISPWLIVCTILFALFLSLCKRRSEVASAGAAGEQRETLRHYTLQFVDQLLSVVTSATVVSYTLYAFQSDTAAEENALIWTVPFVLYGIFRYLYLVYVKNMGESPETMILKDRPLLLSLLLWAGFAIMLLWGD